MERRVKQLVTKCSWCSRVRQEDRWVLERRPEGEVQYTHGICADCMFVNFQDVVRRLTRKLRNHTHLRNHVQAELRRPHVFIATTH